MIIIVNTNNLHSDLRETTATIAQLRETIAAYYEGDIHLDEADVVNLRQQYLVAEQRVLKLEATLEDLRVA